MDDIDTEKRFLQAISGSGGIIATIAKRLNLEWQVAEDFINADLTLKIAYEAERKGILDLCESVVLRNVQLAQEAQRNGNQGDTTDAKWILSRLGKDRGYAERQEVTGKDGGPIQISPAMLIAAMRTGMKVVDEEERAIPEEGKFFPDPELFSDGDGS